MITDIYRIKTKNSVYEIHVKDDGGSRCRKEGGDWKVVKGDSSYLEKLAIGPSFDVPGVVLTSMVKDYVHFVPTQEAKRVVSGQRVGQVYNLADGMKAVLDHVLEEAQGGPVMVADPKFACNDGVEGCTSESPAWHNGSKGCKSGSIASGGTRAHCTCDYCY